MPYPAVCRLRSSGSTKCHARSIELEENGLRNVSLVLQIPAEAIP
jgi:hypothetical protein